MARSCKHTSTVDKHALLASVEAEEHLPAPVIPLEESVDPQEKSQPLSKQALTGYKLNRRVLACTSAGQRINK